MDPPGSLAAPEEASPDAPTRVGPLAVDLRHIRKGFYGVLANDDIDLDLLPGEVHALLGENGAGKSTLCSILAGLYRPDEGEIFVDGERKEFHSPRDALASGIGMVYQHFRLVDSFTVAENLALGHPAQGLRLSQRRIEHEAAIISERFGVAVNPRARIYELSVGEQQRVEILKLLYRGVRILILDEPTAVLTPSETKVLFRSVRAMCNDGKVVVFVSHKLREVLSVSDRVTILRSGRRVSQIRTTDARPGELARLMVGRDVQPPGGVPATLGPTSLSVEGLGVLGEDGHEAVRDVSLYVRAGEIVGIAGVAGNGQRELAEAIAGIRKVARGRIVMNGRDLTHTPVNDRIRHGLAFVPEDRLEMGVAAGLSLEENLILKSYSRPPFSRGLIMRKREIRRFAEGLRQRFDIRGSRPGLPVSLLSGGNVQRAILAREIANRPNVLLAASPTRGLDVGAADFVQRLLLQQRGEGTAILLISEDLDELQILSDRVFVMFEGRMVGEVHAGRFDTEQVGLMMAGHSREDD
jgi:general nucleoside transport system ATP-binding protein